jgi:hypothetical protein
LGVERWVLKAAKHRRTPKAGALFGTQGCDASALTALAMTEFSARNTLKTTRQSFGPLIGLFDSPWLGGK